MTTIVAYYQNKVGYSIAADGQVTGDQGVIVNRSTNKIFPIRNMHIAVSGNMSKVASVEEWAILQDEFVNGYTVADTTSALDLLRSLREHFKEVGVELNSDNDEDYVELLIASEHGVWVSSIEGAVVKARELTGGVSFAVIGTGARVAQCIPFFAVGAILSGNLSLERCAVDAVLAVSEVDAYTGGKTHFATVMFDELAHQEEATLSSSSVH